MTSAPAKGPLTGVRVIELAGIGPAPLACMLLADLGADVIRIDRPTATGTVTDSPSVPPDREVQHRSRPSVAVDLKAPEGAEVVRRLSDVADVFVEGFRPGVTERLGIGPDDLRSRNPLLVYARMTGWGQDGPMAPRAGHDLNYIALTGALWAIGEAGRNPVPPLNLVGDFGGGTMFLVVGVLAALLERATSGEGQVLDVAMVDGAALLMTMAYTHLAAGITSNARSANFLDGGAPFYSAYACADGKFISVGVQESQFFDNLVRVLGVADTAPGQHDRARWPEMRDLFSSIFKTLTRDEWVSAFDGVDACIAPILDLEEAPHGDHLKARGTFTEEFGVIQPQPAPRFSRTPGRIQMPPSPPGHDTVSALTQWGFDPGEVDKLLETGAIAQNQLEKP